MNFANDSMHTSLCLQFEPQHIATACVYLAAQFAEVQPVNGMDYVDILGKPNVEVLASISYQIIELIAERKGAETTMLVKIRTEIETLQNHWETQRKHSSTTSLEEQDAKRPRLS
jgi:hypothetical protein